MRQFHYFFFSSVDRWCFTYSLQLIRYIHTKCIDSDPGTIVNIIPCTAIGSGNCTGYILDLNVADGCDDLNGGDLILYNLSSYLVNIDTYNVTDVDLVSKHIIPLNKNELHIM